MQKFEINFLRQGFFKIPNFENKIIIFFLKKGRRGYRTSTGRGTVRTNKIEKSISYHQK